MAAVIATVAVVGAIAAGTAQAISGAKGKREAKKKQNAAETGLREAGLAKRLRNFSGRGSKYYLICIN